MYYNRVGEAIDVVRLYFGSQLLHRYYMYLLTFCLLYTYPLNIVLQIVAARSFTKPLVIPHSADGNGTITVNKYTMICLFGSVCTLPVLDPESMVQFCCWFHNVFTSDHS